MVGTCYLCVHVCTMHVCMCIECVVCVARVRVYVCAMGIGTSMAGMAYAGPMLTLKANLVMWCAAHNNFACLCTYKLIINYSATIDNIPMVQCLKGTRRRNALRQYLWLAEILL